MINVIVSTSAIAGLAYTLLWNMTPMQNCKDVKWERPCYYRPPLDNGGIRFLVPDTEEGREFVKREKEFQQDIQP